VFQSQRRRNTKNKQEEEEEEKKIKVTEKDRRMFSCFLSFSYSSSSDFKCAHVRLDKPLYFKSLDRKKNKTKNYETRKKKQKRNWSRRLVLHVRDRCLGVVW
jgi:hypothetical protein